MNTIKYRPVGRPSGKVVLVKVSQAKRAIYSQPTADGKKYHPAQSISVAKADKAALRSGLVRAGSRA